MDLKTPKIWLVTIYIGKTPDYLGLWLRSCAWNPRFNWLLLTEHPPEGMRLPDNVLWRPTALSEIKRILEAGSQRSICLSAPYKLCDYRPLFWLLLQHYRLHFDFWGYCDLDVVFGRLERFITPGILSAYDKIYAYGHLTLFRNSPLNNIAFVFNTDGLAWENVRRQENNAGFDERSGVNHIWRRYGLPCWRDAAAAADIDPQFNALRVTRLFGNREPQLFFVENGAVWQGFFDGLGRWRVVEYAYIHFQKRSLRVRPASLQADRFYFSADAIDALPRMPSGKRELRALLGDAAGLTWRERLKLPRASLRRLKNHFVDAWREFESG